MELPDQPRALRDRYSPAEGALAEAAEQAVAAIAAVAGLELEATILQGDDRLEVDLTGPHNELLVAEDGELLVAVEHLLPRVMRGYGGETAAVRVDCENFQEIREERLRSFAQQVAGEVRRGGRAKSLEPLSPADRRIVHLTVADEPGVESESEGSGYLKRVRISPA
jgi:spoIIIJ-associated protein